MLYQQKQSNNTNQLFEKTITKYSIVFWRVMAKKNACDLNKN